MVADSDEPFFVQNGDFFMPTPMAGGPWGPVSLSGKAVVGLIGCELERRHGKAHFLPARMTVDLYRLPQFDPVVIETRVVREGRRIRLIDAQFISGGKRMARATCQFLVHSSNAPGEVWKPSSWNVPPPDELPLLFREESESRAITGDFATATQRRCWITEVREMVGGVSVSPFQRAASACDFTSPWAHSGSAGLGYINTDVTLMLHRLPIGPWVGFETQYHGADRGVAVGECRLYDQSGAIGLATCVALAQAELLPNP